MSEWSWGESNPRPLSDNCPRYDHSRDRGLRLPHCRVSWAGAHRRVFPRCQRSFPPSAFFQAVTLRFCCRAAVRRPRAPLLVTVSLFGLSYQAARANSPSAVLWLPPFKESEATPVARSSSRSQRRNRSAPGPSPPTEVGSRIRIATRSIDRSRGRRGTRRRRPRVGAGPAGSSGRRADRPGQELGGGRVPVARVRRRRVERERPGLLGGGVEGEPSGWTGAGRAAGAAPRRSG